MLKLAKRIAIILISILLISKNLIGLADASNLYEPGVIYERYSIPEGRVILCRVNPQTGMDEKSLDDGETWVVVGGEIEGIIERRGPVSKYTLSVPNDGLFHEVSGFSGEYSKNTAVKMTASWLPTFQKVDFEIRDEVNGGAQGFTLSSGGSKTVTLWEASNWGLYVRVSGQNPQSVSGELYIEFN